MNHSDKMKIILNSEELYQCRKYEIPLTINIADKDPINFIINTDPIISLFLSGRLTSSLMATFSNQRDVKNVNKNAKAKA
jgi:hypothetical protein